MISDVFQKKIFEIRVISVYEHNTFGIQCWCNRLSTQLVSSPYLDFCFGGVAFIARGGGVTEFPDNNSDLARGFLRASESPWVKANM